MDQIRAVSPRLIILDSRFLNHSGSDPLDHFKRDPHVAILPVLIIAELEIQLLRQGGRLDSYGCAVILKPFDLEELASTIQTLIRSTT